MAGGSAHRIIPHLVWCEVHQKKAFTKGNAKKVIKAMPWEKGVVKYPCEAVPNGWHVGHLPQVVREGRMTRGEVYGPRDVA